MTNRLTIVHRWQQNKLRKIIWNAAAHIKNFLFGAPSTCIVIELSQKGLDMLEFYADMSQLTVADFINDALEAEFLRLDLTECANERDTTLAQQAEQDTTNLVFITSSLRETLSRVEHLR